MENKEFEKANIFSFEKSVDYSENAIVSKTVLKRETGNVSLFAFDKGEGLSEHTAPFDALIQVIDGKAEILINRESYFLEANESILMPANIPHAVKALEKFKMILTMIKG
ncbi:MAG: cupin domain-containing protein [Saprospiraceae bacterium]|nr:cupin domain-containing protein [Saprospiraceae bacterium]